MATIAKEHLAIDPPASVADTLKLIPRTPWFRDPHLRKLYGVLIPACLFVAATNGYDGSMLNGLQALDTWNLTFHRPSGSILGLLSASYPLGAVISTPVSAFISDKFGRRWSVFIGSFIMIIGVVLQAASVNGQFSCVYPSVLVLAQTLNSGHVCGLANCPGVRCYNCSGKPSSCFLYRSG
jgi:MFS family permease